MTYKVLIIGLGNIGMNYDIDLPKTNILSHARAFDEHQEFEVSAGIDINIENCKKFSNEYKKKTYNSIKEITDKEIDVVVIATPTNKHLSDIEEILKIISPKLILCEKPLSEKSVEANKIVDLCETKGVPLFLNFIRRTDPAFREVKEKLETNEYEGPFKGILWYTKGLLHNGSHFVDLFEYWFGELKRLKKVDYFDGMYLNDGQVDCYLEYDDASILCLGLNEKNYMNCSFELNGANGKIHCNPSNQLFWSSVNNSQESAVILNEPVKFADDMSRYQFNIAQEIANILAGIKTELTTGQQALKCQLKLESMLEVS